MKKTISESLANSFKAEAHVTSTGNIVLPEKIIQVMGIHLKGDYCCGKNNYLLVSKVNDEYFAGEPLGVRGKYLTLPPKILIGLHLQSGEVVICSYNGVGDYFTMQRNLY